MPNGAVATLTRNSRAVEPDQHADRADQEQHVADPGQRRLRRDRWISPMSLLMRDMMSPSRVRA